MSHSTNPKPPNKAPRSPKNPLKRPGPGRPRKYTPAQAQRLIDQFFKKCDEEKRPYTITGLALALDTSREMLCTWEAEDTEFSYTIKKAKNVVKQSVEEALLSGANPGGYIFWLKNFGWTDRQEITGAGGSQLIPRSDEAVLLAEAFTPAELKAFRQRLLTAQQTKEEG